MMSFYTDRSKVIISIFVTVFVIFAARLFYLQVVDSTYEEYAANNAIRKKIQYPSRGLIYDRHNRLLVYNEAVYDLMIIPAEAKNTNWAWMAELVNEEEEDLKKWYAKARKYSRFSPSVFIKQLSKKDYGRFQEFASFFPGFYAQYRTLRRYPQPIAPLVLGDVGEVNEADIKEDTYYRSGDYIGKGGLEKFYEKDLRGEKGVTVVMVDVLNQEKGSYKNGLLDTLSVQGKNLYTSLDLELQQYAETLMQGKRGSIVAIEPSTGEILALVSAPTYDPNLLVGRNRGKNFAKLLRDPQKPLFDRALNANYPPGSIFKIPQALIGLQEGVITPHTFIPCDRSLVGCHGHPSAAGVDEALKMSCNPYFYIVFKRVIMQNKNPNRFIDSRIGLEKWAENIKRFGFGQKLEIDLPNVKSGFIPNADFYDRIYGQNAWAFSTIYSLSIGQGEISLIPLQMANLAAIVANRGFYYPPHVVKFIGDSTHPTRQSLEKKEVGIDTKYYDYVVDGMYGAVHLEGGTARRARIKDLVVCGKTGTSENPHGDDHSVFIGFAPKDHPQIAVSVFVENSGFGGTWAAPIGSLLIEKYIRDSVTRPDLEKYVLDLKFKYETSKE